MNVKRVVGRIARGMAYVFAVMSFVMALWFAYQSATIFNHMSDEERRAILPPMGLIGSGLLLWGARWWLKVAEGDP